MAAGCGHLLMIFQRTHWASDPPSFWTGRALATLAHDPSSGRLCQEWRYPELALFKPRHSPNIKLNFGVSQMKKISALVGLIFFACTSSAALIDSQVDPSAYITKDGYDIAWASPVNVSSLDLSFQSIYGWSAMSYEMFNTLQISATDFVFSGANAKKVHGWGDTTNGARVESILSASILPWDDVAVATPWFNNTYWHIDWSDGVAGNWSFSNVNGEYWMDSLVYRISTDSGTVPEPASIALVVLGLAGMAASGRRKMLKPAWKARGGTTAYAPSAPLVFAQCQQPSPLAAVPRFP